MNELQNDEFVGKLKENGGKISARPMSEPLSGTLEQLIAISARQFQLTLISEAGHNLATKVNASAQIQVVA